jgi:diguanylate cyclase
MPPKAKRPLQIVVILAIALCGTLSAMQPSQRPLDLLYLFGLITFGVIGVSLSEIETSARKVAGSPDDPKAAMREVEHREQKFDGTLRIVGKLLHSHLAANIRYSDSLERANRDLPGLETPAAVNAFVALLIDENEKIKSKMSELSNSLETARSQVAKLHSNLAEANQIGLRDPLTSLGNRRSFDEKFGKEVTESHNDRLNLCLVLIDLDEFKSINDRFGHPIGDMVLKLFSELISKNIKGRDTAARFGGDEFAIVFPQTTLQQAGLVVDQIRRQLEAKKWVVAARGQPIGKITASFGIAQLLESEAADDLFLRADMKLYEAKAGGRNRITLDSAA